MDLDAVIPLLGATADEPRVVALLQELGITAPPKLKRGDTGVNVEVRSAGLYLVFTDEAFQQKTPNAKIGAGPLLLTNASVYCRPTSTYQAFTGALPFAIKASTGRDAVRAQLGQPEASLDRRRLDRWTIDGCWVFVQYATDFLSIDTMSVQLRGA